MIGAIGSSGKPTSSSRKPKPLSASRKISSTFVQSGTSARIASRLTSSYASLPSCYGNASRCGRAAPASETRRAQSSKNSHAFNPMTSCCQPQQTPRFACVALPNPTPPKPHSSTASASSCPNACASPSRSSPLWLAAPDLKPAKNCSADFSAKPLFYLQPIAESAQVGSGSHRAGWGGAAAVPSRIRRDSACAASLGRSFGVCALGQSRADRPGRRRISPLRQDSLPALFEGGQGRQDRILPQHGPGHDRAVPLQPEFIAPQDGSEKQDCESRASRRWLAAHGASVAHLNPIYLGDDLYSCQPICEAVLAAAGHFLFVCKPQSHPTLSEYLSGVELDTLVETVKRGKQRFRYTYRWMCDLPLRDGADALRVNWLSIEIADPSGKVTYRNSFVTDLPVDRANVVEMAACGRARWKVENETFNTLKTKGYNLEHNFGHGTNHLAAVLVTLNLLAFACHTVADLADLAWQKARAKIHTRAGFFNHLRAITVYVVFPSWQQLMATLAFDKPLARPP